MRDPKQSTNRTPSTRRPTPSAHGTTATPSTSSPTPPAPSGPQAPSPSHRPHGRRLELPGSAFAPAFLEKLRLVARLLEEAETDHPTQAEAELSGPLAVEAVETTGGVRDAVVREDEPVAAGGKVAALFRDRADALRAAAVLPAVAAPSPFRLKDKPKRLGYPLHDHGRHVGHLCWRGGRLSGKRRERFLTHLHVARHLATSPHALALLLEAVGPEALPLLGRALARRIEALLP
jgi:hypothetical protein